MGPNIETKLENILKLGFIIQDTTATELIKPAVDT
jgi:hypothetical protein